MLRMQSATSQKSAKRSSESRISRASWRIDCNCSLLTTVFLCWGCSGRGGGVREELTVLWFADTMWGIMSVNEIWRVGFMSYWLELMVVGTVYLGLDPKKAEGLGCLQSRLETKL